MKKTGKAKSGKSDAEKKRRAALRSWFEELLARSPYPSRIQLSKKMVNRLGKPMDPAAVSRIFTGEQEMSLGEAVQLSELLGVPLDEIAKRTIGKTFKF